MGEGPRGSLETCTSTLSPEVWTALATDRPRLIRLLRSRGESPSDAEDFVQETFIRVARLPRIDLARLSGLATVVAVRIAWETHRREARREQLLSRFLTGSSPSPEELASLRGDTARALAIAAELPGRERVILQMCIAGVPLKEAAQRLGVSYKSAESALGRARLKLRQACYAT